MFIKWKVEAQRTLFIQNYLFNIVIQGNLWMIRTFLYWQQNKLLLITLKLNFHCKNTYKKIKKTQLGYIAFLLKWWDSFLVIVLASPWKLVLCYNEGRKKRLVYCRRAIFYNCSRFVKGVVRYIFFCIFFFFLILY